MAFFDLLDGIGIVIAMRLLDFPIIKLFNREPYEVTGISPQSNTVAQLWNGFASRGTLYPPLNRTLREPLPEPKISLGFIRGYVLEIETSRTLSDSIGSEAGTWTVGGSSVEWSTWR